MAGQFLDPRIEDVDDLLAFGQYLEYLIVAAPEGGRNARQDQGPAQPRTTRPPQVTGRPRRLRETPLMKSSPACAAGGVDQVCPIPLRSYWGTDFRARADVPEMSDAARR